MKSLQEFQNEYKERVTEYDKQLVLVALVKIDDPANAEKARTETEELASVIDDLCMIARHIRDYDKIAKLQAVVDQIALKDAEYAGDIYYYEEKGAWLTANTVRWLGRELDTAIEQAEAMLARMAK